MLDYPIMFMKSEDMVCYVYGTVRYGRPQYGIFVVWYVIVCSAVLCGVMVFYDYRWLGVIRCRC